MRLPGLSEFPRELLALAEVEFTPIVDGLPVAGESGTLKNRFDDPKEAAGRHVVHAKTGTLSGLAGLTGYVTTADGAVLVFAELGNDIKNKISHRARAVEKFAQFLFSATCQQ